MKDSWGGVQNVWYVSPALFPLLVGSMIMLLGALLTRTALKRIGFKEFGSTVRWLFSKALFQFLNSLSNLRGFISVVCLFEHTENRFFYIGLSFPGGIHHLVLL
jgi:uncharacterized membrane protein